MGCNEHCIVKTDPGCVIGLPFGVFYVKPLRMSQNPFEAPRASSHEAPSFQADQAGKFDIGQSVSEAWEATKDNLGLLVGTLLVGGLCAMVSYVTILGIFLLLPVLLWGWVRLYLNAMDGEAAFEDLFSGFSNYGLALGPMLMVMVVGFALGLPGQILNIVGTLTEQPLIANLGTLVSLVIGFTVSYRLYFAPFFVVDQDMSGLDAIRASWVATKDQKLNTLGFVIVAGIVAIAGLFAMCIGGLVSFNVAYLMYASAYRQIVSPAQ